eukprot:jgi/Pico_ML_1/51726/g292.t1
MLTGTNSETAAYEFTTLTCIPGVIHYKDTKIQLLDLPGIIEDVVQVVKKKVAEDGRGRFKTQGQDTQRIADREKKAKLKT